MRTVALAVLLLGVASSGCIYDQDEPEDSYASRGFRGDDPTGRMAARWPTMYGTTLKVLDNGMLAAMGGEAESRFENLTGIKVVVVPGPDAHGIFDKAQRARDRDREPPADVAIGLDHPRLHKARDTGVFLPYTPLLERHIVSSLRGAGPIGNLSTPMAQGHIAVVVDARSPALENVSAPTHAFDIQSLVEVREFADQLVVPDPRTSGRGLAFLLATIGAYGEGSQVDYAWQRYWIDLFRGPDRNNDHRSDGPVVFEETWALAYDRFTADGNGGDKPMAIGTVQTPVVEYGTDLAGNRSRFGGEAEQAPHAVAARHATFHLVEHVAILNGTKNLAAAQAFVEFSLTDRFQELLWPELAMQPVTTSAPGEPCPKAFGAACALRKEAGTQFIAAPYDEERTAANLKRWLCEWGMISNGAAYAELAECSATRRG